MEENNKKYEIERKFLVVSDDYRHIASLHMEISQGYLTKDPHRTVRVRRKGDKGFITVKGFTTGITREEYEYEVPLADAVSMLELCLPVVIEKTRWIVPYEGHIWEVDEFHGALEGLTVAEIELASDNTPFERPAFIGKEVSGDPRYYNSSLSKGGLPED